LAKIDTFQKSIEQANLTLRLQNLEESTERRLRELEDEAEAEAAVAAAAARFAA